MARVTAAEARKVRCPRCYAQPGLHCMKKGEKGAQIMRERVHRERVQAAKTARCARNE